VGQNNKLLCSQAVFVVPAAVYIGWRDRFVELARRYRLPASYHRREFVEIGGLFSYGADLDDAYRLAGVSRCSFLRWS
jgi:hypothetical protein